MKTKPNHITLEAVHTHTHTHTHGSLKGLLKLNKIYVNIRAQCSCMLFSS